MKNIYKTIKRAIIGIALVSSTVATAQSYDNVTSWVGTGSDSTIAVIDFLENDSSTFTWGVRFDDTITGDQILDLIETSDTSFKTVKSQFLSSIEYKGFNSNKPFTYWGTWTKSSSNWESNTGIGDKVGTSEFFGFSFTDFSPALAPYSISFKGVDFWVGSGKDSALAIVDYLENDAAYVWGIRFDDTITGSEILDLISWNDKDFFVNKGAFLSSIDYKSHKSNKDKTYWGTWSKTDGDWFLNAGLSEKISNGNTFGFSYTNFSPAIAPSKYATPAIKTYFEISNAIHKDSSIIELFPTMVTDFSRGLKDIAIPDSGYVGHGDSTDALGAINNSVVSLGDNGSITLALDPFYVVSNGNGPDFAVFENAFSKGYLELAFVEVSSDGTNFVRFPSTSLTQTATQVGGFDNTDAKNIHNLAGKYPANYGTPFDLDELKDNTVININEITHIRIVDVVGSINPQFGSKDSKGNIINEPYATAFNSGGFDLDGIGVINYTLLSPTFNKVAENNVLVYPTQTANFITIKSDELINAVSITNVGTGTSRPTIITSNNQVDVSTLNNGAYLVTITTIKGTYVQKIIKY